MFFAKMNQILNVLLSSIVFNFDDDGGDVPVPNVLFQQLCMMMNVKLTLLMVLMMAILTIMTMEFMMQL